MERKLTAILSADVEGYSRLMGEDEEATVRTLNTYREAMSRLIEEHQGRVIDSPGDNLLAEFTSAVNAVQCAVVIQAELRASNVALAEDRRMNYRIGINLGDVIVDGARIYGDGVNVAARVESLAEGGGICVSGTVYDQVVNKLSYTFDNRGEHTVKNIADPVRVYAVRWDVEKTSDGKDKPSSRWVWTATVVAIVATITFIIGYQIYRERQSLLPTEIPSIAVLPFRDMSPEKDQEYFCEGIAEELLNAFTKVSSLRVAARTSSFRFKGDNLDIPSIGKRLNVNNVLEGSVRKDGNNLRITAQLINVSDGFHLWSDTYDRELKSVFAIQNEIAQAITKVLQVKLMGEAGEPLVKTYTKNIEAYDQYLLGRYYLMKRQGPPKQSEEALRTAIKYFEQAIAIDPNYALAYSGLADVYLIVNSYSSAYSIDYNIVDIKARAEEAAKMALALDPDLAEAHTSFGHSRQIFHLDYKSAEREYRRAIELNPKYAPALNRYSWLILNTGRMEEALVEIRKALELEPFEPVYNIQLGLTYSYVRQHDKAIQQYERTLALDANNPFGWGNLGWEFLHMEKFEDATRVWVRWAELTGNDKEASKLYISLVAEHVLTGEPVSLPAELEESFGSPLMYAALGQKEKTLALLEQAYEEGFSRNFFFLLNPVFDFLRSEPRFIGLMQKREQIIKKRMMGLEEE